MILFARLGLTGADGNLSFNKCVTAAAMALFGVMVCKRLEPSVWVLLFGVTVIGAGFGMKGYLAATARWNVTGTTNTQTDIKLDGNQALRDVLGRESPQSPHGGE